MKSTAPRLRLSAALIAGLLAFSAFSAFSACSSGDDDGGTASEGAVENARGAEPDLDGAGDDAAYSSDRVLDEAPERPAEQAAEKAIISKGDVSLTSDDVEQTASDVQKITHRYGGEVSDEKTSTDEEGEVQLARMVLRIPADDFAEAFADLKEVADLESSGATSEDVTTEVIDNRVRIRAQRRSLRRVEVLLDRAQSISDIVAIEAQLTRRQADLDSLEQQQAYLRDQTSMSTITVTVERAEKPEPEKKDSDEAGFLSGLSAGWDALVTFGTGLATVTGAVIPWIPVVAIVGLPLLLLRRSRRRKTATA